MKRPTTKRGQMRDAAAAAVGRQLGGAPLEPLDEDPFAGCMGTRALVYSVGSDGKKHGTPARERPFWNPHERDQEIFVHGDGYTTAHGGTIGAEQEPDELRLARQAGLTADEIAVFIPRAEGKTHREVASLLGITPRQVGRRIETGNTKLRAFAEVLREFRRKREAE